MEHIKKLKEIEKKFFDIHQELVEYIKEQETDEITLSAERVGDKIHLSFTGNVKDIQWRMNDGDWISIQHMQKETNYNPPDIVGDSYEIGNTNNINNKFEIVIGDGEWNEDTKWFDFYEDKTASATLQAINPDDSNDDGDDEPTLDEKRISLLENSGRIIGVIPWKGKTRAYINAYLDGKLYAYDSDDLENWEREEKPDFPKDVRIFEANGEIYGYKHSGGSAYLLTNFNPDKGFSDEKEIYEWYFDGTLAPDYVDGKFLQLGRVRGLGDKDKGGWGDDAADFLNLDEFPEMKQHFEDHSWFPYEDFSKVDRRGLSIHESEDGDNWSSRILQDPENMDLEEFKGWKDKSANGIADFYSAIPIGDGRVLVKLFVKEKDRLIDREAISDEHVKVKRRFRFTGETIIVPAILKDGEIHLTSTESIIPKELHGRVVTKQQVPWATNPGVEEVGQFTPYKVLYKDDYAYIFYAYRDDLHYEGGWSGQKEGVYIYKMDKSRFDSLFEFDNNNEKDSDDSEDTTTDPIESRKVPVGFYYPQNLTSEMKGYMNCGKTWQVGQIDDILNDYEYCIASISHTLTNDNRDSWESIIRNIGSRIPEVDYDKVLYILVQDEPKESIFSQDDLNNIVDWCDEYWKGIKPAFNYTIGRVNRGTISTKPHVAVINYYPFFERTDEGYVQIFSESEFQNYLDKLLGSILDKNSNIKIGLTGQAFYSTSEANNPWRNPPSDSPNWYKRALYRRKEIIHFQWWAYDYGSSAWVYLKDIPELLENVKKVNLELI